MIFRSVVSTVAVCSLLLCGAVSNAQDVRQPGPTVKAQIASSFAEGAAAAKAAHADHAAQIYWNIVERFPDHPDSPRAAKQAAYCIVSLRNFDNSIAALKRALTLYPKSEFAPAEKRCLAFAYSAKGDRDSAIVELKDLISQFPKSDEACEGLINLALAYTGKVSRKNSDEANWKLKDDADAAFKQVAEMFPAKREACAKAEMYRAGIAYERAREKRTTYRAAGSQIQSVLDAYPDAPAAIRARGAIMLAEMALDGGDASVAAQRAEAVLKSYPTCRLEVGWANYLAGNAYEEIRRYDSALVHYTAVIDGKYTKAENFKDRDITLYSLLRSAECYKKIGQVEKAKAALEAVVAAYPKTAASENAKASLQKLSVGG